MGERPVITFKPVRPVIKFAPIKREVTRPVIKFAAVGGGGRESGSGPDLWDLVRVKRGRGGGRCVLSMCGRVREWKGRCPVARSRVEAEVESVVNGVFGGFLYDQLREVDRVAAPDGQCEAFGFGAVNPLPGAFVVPWGEFEDDPGWAVTRFLRKRRREVSPVVLAEYDRGAFTVSLRLGRHVPITRAHAGSVLLG